MVKCFNEWMRRFIEEPDRFQQEFETINGFLRDEAKGRESTYGEACSALMQKLATECPVD